ncbi:MAG: GtrA family protein [Dermatophilaceae bacterium]
MSRQLLRFAVVGGASTLLHLALFAGFRSAGMPSAQAANILALVLATLANTTANRRWTFGVRSGSQVRHQAQGFVLLGVSWVVTAGSLALVHALVPHPGTLAETGALAIATVLGAVVRYLLMRGWMFRGSTTVGQLLV